jgi:hypothetical protein
MASGALAKRGGTSAVAARALPALGCPESKLGLRVRGGLAVAKGDSKACSRSSSGFGCVSEVDVSGDSDTAAGCGSSSGGMAPCLSYIERQWLDAPWLWLHGSFRRVLGQLASWMRPLTMGLRVQTPGAYLEP